MNVKTITVIFTRGDLLDMATHDTKSESCPCCGSIEWKEVNRWDGYGMTCYECVVCGFQVVE